MNAKMNLYKCTISLLALISFTMPNLLWAGSKVALVIGNSSYATSRLANPANDAQDMSVALRSLGFEVSVYVDLNRSEMRKAIRQFGEKLRRSEVGLFYYAGHGIQIKGRNYLVPLQTDVSSADEVEDESIDAGSVLRKMESAGNEVNIVILDACRNNPFSRSFRSLEQGLARMDGPVGSYIAYATSPGSVAADGEGRNGLYTKHLLKALHKPGLTIEQTFKSVRNGVRGETHGKQIPWESSSLTGEFVFMQGQKTKIVKADPFIAPPVVSRGHLQIIANVPNATISINNIVRGKIDESGVLNIRGIAGDDIDVLIEAPGYRPESQQVKLIPGKWQKLNVNLEYASKSALPNSRPEEDIRGPSPFVGAQHCLQGKRALMTTQSEFQSMDGKLKIKNNNPKLYANLHNELRSFGLEFIDAKFASNRLMETEPGPEAKYFYKQSARQLNIQYLIKASVKARSTPVKLFKTNMKTIYGDITLELIDLLSGRIVSESTTGFRKVGTDLEFVFNNSIEQKITALANDFMGQACL